MRTVLSGIHLFNDNLKIVGEHFYIKRKRRGREQDSRETERECVWVRGSAWWKRRDSIGHKMSHKRNTFGWINVGLISKIPA